MNSKKWADFVESKNMQCKKQLKNHDLIQGWRFPMIKKNHVFLHDSTPISNLLLEFSAETHSLNFLKQLACSINQHPNVRNAEDEQMQEFKKIIKKKNTRKSRTSTWRKSYLERYLCGKESRNERLVEDICTVEVGFLCATEIETIISTLIDSTIKVANFLWLEMKYLIFKKKEMKYLRQSDKIVRTKLYFDPSIL